MFEQFKTNQKYYVFFRTIFDNFQFLVFKLLQSKYSMIFQESSEEVINLYTKYINFANNRKNSTKILTKII